MKHVLGALKDGNVYPAKVSLLGGPKQDNFAARKRLAHRRASAIFNLLHCSKCRRTNPSPVDIHLSFTLQSQLPLLVDPFPPNNVVLILCKFLFYIRHARIIWRQGSILSMPIILVPTVWVSEINKLKFLEISIKYEVVVVILR